MKIYYKDIDLSKRDFEIINNKKVYMPLNICIYEKDVVEMLDDMYKFYSIRRHEIHSMYKFNEIEFKSVCDHKIAIGRLKSWIKFGTYKKWDEHPKRKGYTELLYYLSIDGYIPHRDKLEIIKKEA